MKIIDFGCFLIDLFFAACKSTKIEKLAKNSLFFHHNLPLATQVQSKANKTHIYMLILVHLVINKPKPQILNGDQYH